MTPSDAKEAFEMLLSSDDFRFSTPERVRNEHVHTFAYYTTNQKKLQEVFAKKNEEIFAFFHDGFVENVEYGLAVHPRRGDCNFAARGLLRSRMGAAIPRHRHFLRS